jgi:hypothetical protein
MTTSKSTSQNRPKANRAEIVAVAAHVSLAVIASLGVYTFYHTLTAEKIQNAEESIGRLYPLDLNINQKLADYPTARDCLRDDPDGERYRSLKPEDQAVLQSAIEAYGDLFEYYDLIRDRIKHHPNGKEIVRSWDKYLKDICKNSCAFRERIDLTRKQWTNMFLNKFDKYATRFATVEPEPSLSAETPARQSPPKP